MLKWAPRVSLIPQHSIPRPWVLTRWDNGAACCALNVSHCVCRGGGSAILSVEVYLLRMMPNLMLRYGWTCLEHWSMERPKSCKGSAKEDTKRLVMSSLQTHRRTCPNDFHRTHGSAPHFKMPVTFQQLLPACPQWLLRSRWWHASVHRWLVDNLHFSSLLKSFQSLTFILLTEDVCRYSLKMYLYNSALS